MYDGTLRVNWKALVTFQQLIVLCDADGTVDMTPHAISGRTGIPIEVIQEGLEFLEKPDPYSRTPDEEGRRIALIDDHRPWGWYIVNHSKYKVLQDSDSVREQNRERKRRQREREKCGHGASRSVTVSHGPSRHTDTDTDKDLYPSFEEFWKAWPKRVEKADAKKAWSKLSSEDRKLAVAAVARWPFPDDLKFCPGPGKWLRGNRWEDETTTTGEDSWLPD